MTERNTPFAKSIKNCGATFLNPDTTPSLCYSAAKQFVDEYEREQHEQRRAVPDPAQRALPPEWSDDKQKAYTQLASAVFEGGNFDKIQKAAKSFVEICKREEREKKPKPDRAWSPEKHQAYNRLLDDFIGHKHYDEIIADARRLAAVCNREEHEQPKVGEVYRDILGNKYIVTAVHDSFPDDARGNKPFIVLKHVESNGRIALPDYFAPYLEDFMNPTFKKYN